MNGRPNGGTHYQLSTFRQPLSSYTSCLHYVNIFWQQWNTFTFISRVSLSSQMVMVTEGH